MNRILTRALTALTVVAVSIVGLTAAVSAPAQADEQFACSATCSFKDAKGDAPKKADLRGGRLANNPTSFSVKFKVASLPRYGAFVVGAGLSGWTSNWLVKKTKDGIAVAAWEISETTAFPAKECPTATVSWNRKKDVVKAVLPHECSGSTAGGGSVITGIDFTSGKAKDSAGHVYYEPEFY